jgi:hypothetical protein
MNKSPNGYSTVKAFPESLELTACHKKILCDINESET